MAFDYAKPAATAQRLLERFGSALMLTRSTPAAYNPATGTATSTSADHAGFGVRLDYEQREIDGTNIRRGDARIYVAPDLAVTPQTGDSITMGADVWQVVASRPLAPAGVVVIHDVQVRA